MLLSSCGSNNPTGAKAPNAVIGPNGLAIASTPPTLNPASKSPLPPVLTDPIILTLSPASIADILKEPHANPNASSPNKKPFSQLCGDYREFWIYVDIGKNQYGVCLHTPVKTFKPVSYQPPTGWINVLLIYLYPDNCGKFYCWGQLVYSIPCGLFPPDFLLPDDFFTGNGFPDGNYVINGNLYEKGTDANGNPTVKDWGAVPKDANGNPIYPDGVYPPTNPSPPAQPPNNPPPANNNPPPNASAATLVGLTIYTNTPTIPAGKTTQFNVIGTMSDGSTDPTVTNTTVNWQSDNTPVSIINGNGLATTHIEGTANIWVTYNGLTSNPIPLTVTAPELTKITISPASASIAALNVAKFTAQAVFSNNSTRDITYQVNWSSTNTIVTSLREYLNIYPFLSSGYTSYQYDLDNTFIGLKNGTATISAASGGISGTADIMVGCRVPLYQHIRQNVPTWMDWPYDGYTSTGAFLDSGVLDHSIGAVGCNLTVDNMVLNTLGENTDPQQLNEWLTQHDGWLNDGPDWDVLKNYSANMKSKIKSVEVEKPYNTDEIDSYLKNCNIVIALVAGQWRTNSKGQWVQSFPHHYVLIVGGQHGDYKIYDPWKHKSTDPTPQEENINTFGQYLKYTAITLN